MNRPVISILPILIILCSSFQCSYLGPGHLVKDTMVWIYPDTLHQTDDITQLDLAVKFPSNKKIKVLDSISFLLTTVDKRDSVLFIGGFTIDNNDIINIIDTFENRVSIQVGLLDVDLDTTSIYFHEEFFRFGRSLLSDRLNIGTIIKNER